VTTEIIVDNFCGGGGASTGISLAIGRSVDIAINHDPAAIAMHKVNHPDTEHYCESVWEVDPRKAANGRPVGLVWLSPDCKHFSKAKGGKPVQKNIRGLAWVAVRWAATVKPRVIMLENVEEFKAWGPLLVDGKPDPKQKGRTFNTFVHALERQGYQVQHRELRACDYGAPTIRKRFFMIARCDGLPIVWPKPTHGDTNSPEVKSGKLKPWRTAAEIIDWSLPCPSIFDTSAEIKQKYGIKAVRPLAENTMRRIARGIQKFVIDNPKPFIMQIGQTGFSKDERSYSLGQPLTTIVTKAEHCLVAPTLIQYHSETANHEARGQTLDKPIMTLDTSPRYGLVTSHLLQMNNHCDGRSLDDPINTIVAGPGHWGEVRTFLLKYYGTGEGQRLEEPLATITTRDRFGLITVLGQDYQIVDIGMRMLEPRELFNAQGFPGDYIIDRDAEGKIYPKSAQVARCGNAVPPPFAEHLVRVNLPELCGESSCREVING